MPTISRLNVKLLLDTLGFTTGGAKAIGTATKLETRFGALKTAASNMAAGFAAGFGIYTVVNFLKQSVQASEEARLASAKLASTLKSTGNTTGFSQKALESYAEELQALTAIEDDSIVAATAVLSRFRNISGSVFKDATRLAVDLSKETGNLDGAFLLLGKALSDPTKGMVGLTRAGVKFSAEQKTQIKDLMTAGNLFGAQTIILRGVEKAYGGLAQAQKSSWEDFKNSWGQYQEAIGKAGTSQGGRGVVGSLSKDLRDSARDMDRLSEAWSDNGVSTFKVIQFAMLALPDAIAIPAPHLRKLANEFDNTRKAAEGLAKVGSLKDAMRGLLPGNWKSPFNTQWDLARPASAAAATRNPSRDPGGNSALIQGSAAANSAMNAFRRANATADRQVKILEGVRKAGDMSLGVLKEIRNQGIGGKPLKVADF